MPARGKPIQGWTPTMGFFTGMFWDLEERAERRPGFPSWSWTSWHGPVKWGEQNWPSIGVDPNVQLSVERIDGRVLKWESFQELASKANLNSQFSNVIHITAWTIPIRIDKREGQKNKDTYTAKVDLEDGGYLFWTFESESKVELSRGQLCTGIILGYSFEDNDLGPRGPAILVVCKIDNTMERVGCGWVDQIYYKRYNEDSVWQKKGYDYVWSNPIYLEPLNLVKSREEVRPG